MSRRIRNPFSRISRLFKEHSDPSCSTSSPSTGPAPTQTQFPTQSSPPNIGVPSVGPPPIPQLYQPPTPSPYTLPSQPLPQSIEHGALSSGLTASSQPPPDLLLPQLAPDATRQPLQPQASRAPAPQSGRPTFFAGAHGFNIYNSQFNDTSLVGSGINKLLENSMPDAFHNSAARYPPPKCHLGTREEYITKITDWALGDSDNHEPILWMCGPFGVGKSAVAQSCAEALQRQNKLAATLFFSRSNANRDDPRGVFTSIAYQIAAICPPFRDIVGVRIRDDPALATKSLLTQFEELLIYPLRQIGNIKSGIEGRVVIIDGLDECRGSSEQCEIIRVIATSTREQTTPLHWFITSRPEDSIIRTMKSPTVFPVSFHLELPVSRKIDHEILLYLTDEFNKIRESRGLAESWPSDEDLALLVDRTAGLWIYAATIIRFITDENSLGPRDQLRIVLKFAKDISAKVGADNPLAEMDFFYALILQRVPLKIRTLVRKILLLDSYLVPLNTAGTLGLSEEQLRHSCAFIQSVMELKGSSLRYMTFHFYHASFLDYMRDPIRSKELCIYGDFLTEYRRERLDWLHQICSCGTGPEDITFPTEPVLPEGMHRITYYSHNLRGLWLLCSAPAYPIDLQTAVSLEKLPFRMLLRLMGHDSHYILDEAVQQIRNNLPIEFRDKIIHEDECPIPGCTNTKSVWIFGHGENETVTECTDGRLELRNNQEPGPGWCFCGSRVRREGDNELSDSDSLLSL